MIDDSELFHGAYDPARAREYYLRTRKLKGRKKGVKAEDGSTVRPGFHSMNAIGGKPNRSKTKSRRAELQAQKEALQKRLDHLREVLKQRVKEAKSRNDAQKPKKDEKDKAPETSVDKASRNAAEKKAKPLTAKQKSEKAKKAKKDYEKEHPNSLADSVEVLREQVKDIRAKIEKATSDAQPKKKAGK